MRVGELIQGLNVRFAGAGSAGESDVRICDITEDSRTVMPGSMFVARKGLKADGRTFVAQAARAGAVAILSDDPTLAASLTDAPHPVVLLIAADLDLAIAQVAERFFGEPSASLNMIGVTGTNGKTTITFLMHQMLNHLGVRTGLIGTVSIDDGVEMAPASMTTPPALELSRTLARMLEAGCACAVMEVSSHALHQRRVGALRFRTGVFTNLTGDHLDYHVTMDQYAAAKAMLFDALPADGAAIVNLGDSWHSRMVQGCKARIRRCRLLNSSRDDASRPLEVIGGTAPESLYTARIVQAGATSTDVEFAGGALSGDGPRVVRLPLVGEFNVVNALQALAGLHSTFGPNAPEATRGPIRFTLDQLLDALSRVHAPPGRLEPVTRDDESLSVLVDYAHTDDALKTVLSSVRGAMQGRRAALAKSMGIDPARLPGGSLGQLWCVFGCGGDRDRTKRPRMGRVASELADQIVITSDNPRTEDPASIIREVEGGVPEASRQSVMIEPDREKAIRMAIRLAKPGDTVLIAGKGHEDYQIFADPHTPGKTITRHFDDREIARIALEARGIQARPCGAAHAEIKPEVPLDEVALLASRDWKPPVDE